MNKNRLFFDIEKEVDWLNKMANRGYRLTKKSFFTYYFDNSNGVDYLYQVEKISHDKAKEYDKYAKSLKDCNIDIVANQFGWVYYEKVNDGSDFKINTDTNLKIKHYRNIVEIFLIYIILSLGVISTALNKPLGSQGPYIFNLSLPVIISLVLILLLSVNSVKYILKIKKVKNQSL